MKRVSMKHLFYSVILSAVFVSVSGQASHDKLAEVTGLVASFDATTVKLYVHGQYVKVPKTSLTKESKIAVGNEVTAFVDMKRDIASEKSK
jgi:hypothetical protein